MSSCPGPHAWRCDNVSSSTHSTEVLQSALSNSVRETQGLCHGNRQRHLQYHCQTLLFGNVPCADGKDDPFLVRDPHHQICATPECCPDASHRKRCHCMAIH